MGFRAARIPYILLGTTTPSRPRFTVMTWASAAASTDEILLAGKNSRKRILPEPAAAASTCERCAPSPTKTRPTPSIARLRAAVTSGFHTFGDNARAHVFTENDNPRCVAQRPAMQDFPDLYEPARLNDGATHGHVRIHVPDVVDVRFTFQHSHDRANDSLKRRIGHRCYRV